MSAPFIVEVWCSPLRQEIYHQTIIPVFAGEPLGVEDDLKQEYLSGWGNFFFDAFGEDHFDIKGLWKVVFSVDVSYENYYDFDGPDCDVQFEYKEIFKGQCSSWNEVCFVWSGIKEKLK